jgi:hypothetical protein
MLVREDDLVITQPAHAWLSGQLACAWGDALSPREAVCLAAGQHDVGWVERDLDPLLNESTGRPRAFTEMPPHEHLAIWGAAPRRMLAQSRYAALLVSLHGTTLYGERERTPEISAYLEDQRALQARLSAGLDPDEIDRNRRLLRAWDRMSLALCLDWPPGVIGDVPGFGDLSLAGATVSPWPFTGSALDLVTEAVRLPGRFTDEGSLRAAFATAETVEIRLTLRRVSTPSA